MNVRPRGICGVMIPGTAGATGAVDIAFDGDIVAEILPHYPHRCTGDDSSDWIDLRGYAVLPAAADPHAHLDKSRSWDLIDPPVGDLPGAVTAWSAAASAFAQEDILARARTTALTMVAAGTTAVRSHVDVYDCAGTGNDPFRGIRAIDQLREELRGVMTLQIVALVPAHTPADRLSELVHGALDAGADLVGVGRAHV